MKRAWKRIWVARLTITCMAAASLAQTPEDALKKGFENPPSTARPRVWWHWMNGNITKEGIKLDLEWMHKLGIAGYQNFDAALSPILHMHRFEQSHARQDVNRADVRMIGQRRFRRTNYPRPQGVGRHVLYCRALAPHCFR